MTEKQFFDWQTRGGVHDVQTLVHVLESAQVPWCMIGGLAVNHWAEEPMATADVDLVLATDRIEETVRALIGAGFQSKSFEWSINLMGTSKLSIQISTESIYQAFPSRSVATEVHGILMRVACKEDVLTGKILAYRDHSRRPSKRTKDLLDIMRLVEAHIELMNLLPPEIAQKVAALEDGQD